MVISAVLALILVLALVLTPVLMPTLVVVPIADVVVFASEVSSQDTRIIKKASKKILVNKYSLCLDLI